MKTRLALAILSVAVFTGCQEQELPEPPATPDPEVLSTTPSDQMATSYSCKNILIDGSHDGGVWWFPQAGPFEPAQDHQGKILAESLRKKGFHVDELGRDAKVTDAMLANYATVIRATGFEAYNEAELLAYEKAVNRGITLWLLADHTRIDPQDELAEKLGVKFEGSVDGTISRFVSHPMSEGLSNVPYMVGSAIANANQNPKIKIIGWLNGNVPVMGVLEHSKSNIFLMGDTNTVQFHAALFVDRVAAWAVPSCDLD